MRLGLREAASEGPTVLHIQFCSLSNNSKWQLGAPADMTTVFHAWSYDRSTETPSNLRKKKFHQTNQGSNFLGGGFSNRASLSAWIHFGRENQAQHLMIFHQEWNQISRWYFIKYQDDISSRTESSIFPSIAPVLLDRSNKTKRVFPALKSTSHFMPQSTVPCRSDSSSEANFHCCYRSHTRSHF